MAKSRDRLVGLGALSHLENIACSRKADTAAAFEIGGRRGGHTWHTSMWNEAKVLIRKLDLQLDLLYWSTGAQFNSIKKGPKTAPKMAPK